MTYVIAVVSIYMGFQELAPISSKLIFILLTLYVSEKINYSDSVLILTFADCHHTCEFPGEAASGFYGDPSVFSESKFNRIWIRKSVSLY